MFWRPRAGFHSCSKATRARFGAIAKLRSYVKDELIYLAGDAPDGVFGLVSGSLNISYPRADGEDYTVHRAGAGFWIGDLALFSSAPRLVSVRAAEPTLMAQLPGKELARLLRNDPRLYGDFYALTYENFRTALRIISNLAIASTDKRLADRLLLLLSEVDSRSAADGWIPISQPELAKLLAVSLPTLQRVMRRFVNAGVLISNYARIRVIDRKALEKLCIDPSTQPQGRRP